MVDTMNLWMDTQSDNSIENIVNQLNTPPIPINYFPSSVDDHRWILNHSNKINSLCQGMFEWFFSQNHIGVHEMPDYMCIPMQCEILHNYRLRYFLIIDDAGILYLAILKLNDPIGHKPRFVLSYKILPSVFGHSTDSVHKALMDVGVEKESVVSNCKPYNYNYYNLEADAKKMMSSKWRSSHGINKLSSMISVSGVTQNNIGGVITLLNKWAEVKGHGGTSNHIKCAKMAPQKNLIQKVYLIDDIVVGYAAITKFCDNYFVMICKHVGQLSMVQDKFICDHIGDYIIWDLHKMILDENVTGLFTLVQIE